jgi:protein-tyrosine phosphatase
MIDIHCHILPDIDDGAQSVETSVEMMRIASDDGITHIVATPHYRYDNEPAFKDINDRTELLRKKAAEKQIDIEILSGADIGLTYELIGGIEQKKIPTLNRSRYFLIELPDLIPPNIDNVFFTAELSGLVPIITHPERNYSFLTSPKKLEQFRGSGALVQLTAMSITGEFGSNLQKFSHMLLKKGHVDFIASDAHSTGIRKPVLSKVYNAVSRFLNEKEARRLIIDNPRAVIEDRELSKQQDVGTKQ